MELVRVDTQRAYELIWEKITTLELAPGAAISEGQLAEELGVNISLDLMHELCQNSVVTNASPVSLYLT